MSLLQLPTELLWAILDQAVVTLGPAKVLRLRLVSRYLARETLAAFFHTLAKQPLYKKEVGQLASLRSHMVASILRGKVLLDRNNQSDLLVTIRRTARDLVVNSEDASMVCRRHDVETINRLCELAVEHLGKFATLRHLQADCDTCYPFLKKNDSEAFGNDVDHLIAVAYLGKASDKFLGTLGSGGCERLESKYFGKVLPAAAAKGHNDLVKLFLVNHQLPKDLIAGIRTEKHDYRTLGLDKALTLASASGHNETIRLLLESDFFYPENGLILSNTEFEDAILTASRHGHQSTINLLYQFYESHCSHHPWWPSQTSVLNQCILLEASRAGHIHIAKQQLSLGVNPNCKDARAHGETPLRYAAMHGHTETMRVLLAHGAHVADRQVSARPDPLYAAAEDGHIDAVKLLLEQPGIDVNGPRDVSWPQDIAWPRSPLVGAAVRGQDRVVRYLLDIPGIELERKSAGMQALYRAVQEGWETIARMLWEHGVAGRDWERVEAFGKVMFGKIEGEVPAFLLDRGTLVVA